MHSRSPVLNMDSLPSDILRILAYSSGLACVEDRVCFVLSCRSTLNACAGETGTWPADGGELHWLREVEMAGYIRQRHPSLINHGTWRAFFFARKALRCACCNVPISHHTGRMTTTGYQGRGVQLSSCARCGPLVHMRKDDALDVEYVFGRFTSRRHLETMIEQAAASRAYDREEQRGKEVREALMLSGMSYQRVELALAGSAAFSSYVRLTKQDGAALSGTVANICRRHWMNGYTWLPCASTLCGLPFSNATKEHLYRLVLTAYGGYPSVWPWKSPNTADREVLADMLVDFYADSMMLDALFQRLVKNDLCWLGDHAWLGRIRDALLAQQRRQRRQGRPISFVTSNLGLRVAQLVMEAEFVGGYRVRRSDWHVTFSVQ